VIYNQNIQQPYTCSSTAKWTIPFVMYLRKNLRHHSQSVLELVDGNRFEVPRVVVEVLCRTVGHLNSEFGNSANRFKVSRRCRRRFSRREGHHKSVTTRFEVLLVLLSNSWDSFRFSSSVVEFGGIFHRGWGDLAL